MIIAFILMYVHNICMYSYNLYNYYYYIYAYLKTESTSLKSSPAVGKFVPVQCDKYREWPLIRSVCEKFDGAVQITWYIGTYSRTWKEWKGRSEGKYVTFQDRINHQDVLMHDINFTKSMRLYTSKMVNIIKGAVCVAN